MPDKKQTHSLIEALLLGDQKGIHEIYRQIYPKVLSYILKSDGGEEDAKDIFQKGLMLLSARAQASDFTLNSTLEAYLFTICKNLWRREAKINKLKVTNERVFPLITEEKEIALAAIEQEKWELFQEKLLEISENCRKVLGYFFDKLPYQKIAEKLGYNSENVVRQRIFKCKKKLKDAIIKDGRYKELKG